MRIIMGGYFEGLYWESGVLQGILENQNKIDFYLSGTGSLIGIFFSLYQENFLGKLKNFLYEKENPLNSIISKDIYQSRYSQITSLYKLGRGNNSLYNNKELEEYLKSYFKTLKISDLKENIELEVFDLKNRQFKIISKETYIYEALTMELSVPPYYQYYEYDEGLYIPSSYLSIIPVNDIKNDDIIISYESKVELPIPKNGVEILLKISNRRSIKNYRIYTNSKNKIEPENISENPYNIKEFFNGKKAAYKFLEGINEN
jgi:predicted acylesterase/phospholipase RssA